MYLWNLVSTISYAGCVFNFLWPLTIKGTPRDSDSSEVIVNDSHGLNPTKVQTDLDIFQYFWIHKYLNAQFFYAYV